MTWLLDTGITTGTLSNYASKNKSIVRGLAYHRRVYRTLKVWQMLNARDQELKVEPWLRHVPTRKLLQPDAVVLDHNTCSAIVIEVKLNWKDGRDVKLIEDYLPAVQTAFGLDCVWPALITSNVAGLAHQPRLGLGALLDCCDWAPGDPTPVVLLP